MLQIGAEQRVCYIRGVKFGGQPGESSMVAATANDELRQLCARTVLMSLWTSCCLA
jgi:hypothetical protein